VRKPSIIEGFPWFPAGSASFQRVLPVTAGRQCGGDEKSRRSTQKPGWGLERALVLTNKAAEPSADQSAEDSHAGPKCLQRRECGYACSLCAQYALAQTQTEGAMADGEALFILRPPALRAYHQSDRLRWLMASPGEQGFVRSGREQDAAMHAVLCNPVIETQWRAQRGQTVAATLLGRRCHDALPVGHFFYRAFLIKPDHGATAHQRLNAGGAQLDRFFNDPIHLGAFGQTLCERDRVSWLGFSRKECFYFDLDLFLVDARKRGGVFATAPVKECHQVTYFETKYVHMSGDVVGQAQQLAGFERLIAVEARHQMN